MKTHRPRTSILVIIFSIVLIAFFSILYVTYDYVPEAKYKFVEATERVDQQPNVLKIGIIGESWAAGKKIDKKLKIFLEQTGIKTKVISSGHPGAKTSMIYRNLFKSSKANHSSRHILFDPNVDMIIVFGGINDSATYMGHDFYAHNTKLIADAITARGITPLIINVPEYGLEYIEYPSIRVQFRRWLTKAINDFGISDTITAYRSAAAKAMANGISNRTTYLFDFSAVSTDYSKNRDLYRPDHLHLNNDGNLKLAKALADQISKIYLAAHHRDPK